MYFVIENGRHIATDNDVDVQIQIVAHHFRKVLNQSGEDLEYPAHCFSFLDTFLHGARDFRLHRMNESGNTDQPIRNELTSRMREDKQSWIPTLL